MEPIRIAHDLENRSAVQMTEKLRKYAERREFLFEGDPESGNFAARGIEGTYAIEREEENERVVVEITKKPFYVPESILCSKAKERLERWDSVEG